eukprot:tig00001339_g8267.t1
MAARGFAQRIRLCFFATLAVQLVFVVTTGFTYRDATIESAFNELTVLADSDYAKNAASFAATLPEIDSTLDSVGLPTDRGRPLEERRFLTDKRKEQIAESGRFQIDDQAQGAPETDIARLRAYARLVASYGSDKAELNALERLLARIGPSVRCEQWWRVFGLERGPTSPDLKFIDTFNRHGEAVRLFEKCMLPSVCAEGAHSVSQYGQELVVLRRHGKHRPGFFVEIGSGDGVTHSTTYLLEKCWGWEGICIEASPAHAGALARMRRSCRPLALAVAGREEAGAAFRLAGELSGLVAHYDRRTLDRVERDFPEGATVEVQAASLPAALALAGVGAGRRIDYLAIDASGAELAVLEGAGLQGLDVGLVTAANLYLESHLCDFMKPRGFVCDQVAGDDLFYRPK